MDFDIENETNTDMLMRFKLWDYFQTIPKYLYQVSHLIILLEIK